MTSEVDGGSGPAVPPYAARRNWGRWGDDDQQGAANLITPEKRVAAARLVRSGTTVSLSRALATEAGPGNAHPAQHYMKTVRKPGGDGAAVDYYGVNYHGYAITHLDALGHLWLDGQVWNGRAADDVVTTDGLRFGGVEQWSDGLVTRGVLLDVPAHRGAPYVTDDAPVTGDELEAIATAAGVAVEPGDALFVHSGREAWEADHGPLRPDLSPRPGLHASCRSFVRDHDVAILGWDMMDAAPNDHDTHWAMHGVLQAYGVALIDNVRLPELVAACEREHRHDFMVVVAPLRVTGGTGSPVNPVAVL